MAGRRGRRGKPRLYGKLGMVTKEQGADVFDRIRRFSSADEVEAIFTGSRFALTRFANNTIHQNVEEENSIVSIRTNFAGRTARATANQFDDESLWRAVAASESLARVQAPDPDLLPMPTPEEAECRTGESPVPTRFFEQTAAITPADRAEVVKSIVSIAGEAQADDGGHLLGLGIRRRNLQLSWISELASADVGGDFHHHAGRGFFRLAEIEFARCA